MKYQYVADLHEGDEVNDYFLFVHKDLKTQPSGEKFLGFAVRDKTGEIGGIVWEKPAEIARKIEVGDVVVVKGTVKVYKERLQIHANNLIPLGKGQYSIEDLTLPEEPIEHYLKELWAILDSIQNPWLQKLIQSIRDDSNLMDALICAPAAKKWHHELRGGLIRHCYELMSLALTLCKFYPNINKDLLLTACFLHDIGKIHELYTNQLFVDYTDCGKLIGHVVEGAMIVSEKIKNINGFPEDLKLHLLHCILSHHGEYENGAPVLPKTLEAVVLYHLDNLDAQAFAITRIEQETIKKGEKWSEFIPLISRQIWTKR
ncbi:MAG TPA: CRISPR-associated endonuclease Cas3'' [Candidatus Hydrogenedens sp.]|nr:CRISPR-associated endonuclease Cas3'' [Candidatus Hydrogenedens sp.]HOK10349.1 CRISPR-associated endonuclease Cas3'' [Candidatus Hydrogenedens sp.]HOL21164.1 CRISPR-associated endonuclease Cas3'' [Candidatus Hydrogenedens sp.]HPP59883.1 CRISPR-associated endonuclease Cas3'' [Candidatus Hydrogenedens sp.]